MLQSMGSQRVINDLVAEQQQQQHNSKTWGMKKLIMTSWVRVIKPQFYTCYMHFLP